MEIQPVSCGCRSIFALFQKGDWNELFTRVYWKAWPLASNSRAHVLLLVFVWLLRNVLVLEARIRPNSSTWRQYLYRTRRAFHALWDIKLPLPLHYSRSSQTGLQRAWHPLRMWLRHRNCSKLHVGGFRMDHFRPPRPNLGCSYVRDPFIPHYVR